MLGLLLDLTLALGFGLLFGLAASLLCLALTFGGLGLTLLLGLGGGFLLFAQACLLFGFFGTSLSLGFRFTTLLLTRLLLGFTFCLLLGLALGGFLALGLGGGFCLCRGGLLVGLALRCPGTGLLGPQRLVGSGFGAYQRGLHHRRRSCLRLATGQRNHAHHHYQHVQANGKQRGQAIAYTAIVSGHDVPQFSLEGGSEISPTLATPATCKVLIRVTTWP